MKKQKILIATCVPFWKQVTGSQNRISTLAEYLNQKFQVTLFYFGNFYPPAQLNAAINIVTPPFNIMARNYIGQKKKSFLKRLGEIHPRLFRQERKSKKYADFVDAELAEYFCRYCRDHHFDVVIVEYVKFTFLIDSPQFPRDKTTVLLDSHDLQYKRNKSFQEVGRQPPFVIGENEEMRLIEKFDYVIAIQNNDYLLLEQIFPGRAILAMHPYSSVTAGARNDLLTRKLKISFLAGHQDHNVDALTWFINTIWDSPLQKDFTLHIYGSIGRTSYCKGLSAINGVFIHGNVKCPADAFIHCDIAVNPIQAGSGLKIKNIEAIACGIPLITSTVGLEGLETGVGKFIMKADTEEEYLNAFAGLKSADRRKSFSEAALSYARENLSAKSCFKDLVDFINKSGPKEIP